MRIPISFVRCETVHATTPKMPIAARMTASAARQPIKVVLKRGCDTEEETMASIVSSADTGWLGSMERISWRNADAVVAGSTDVRATSDMPGTGRCGYGTYISAYG